VLYLVYTPYPGRASTTVPTEGWFQHLRARGLEPVVVCSHAGHFYHWALEQGVPAYVVPFTIPSKRWPFPFLRSLWLLRRIVKRHAVELIHCNEQERYPLAQYLGRICKVPVVVSVHFTMQRGFCEWAFGGARNPRRMFFLSRGSQQACEAGVNGIVPEETRRLLYNGLDLEHYRPSAELRARFREELGVGQAPLIGVACALRPRKQLEHMFAAVGRLNVPGLRVVVAGGPMPGDEAYAKNLLHRAQEQLGDRLLCLGHLSELRGFYNALDLFVNASQEEACSISIMEALACGCPIVGYPSTSVDEQILPSGGEIVEQDNVEQLRDCLERWLCNPEKLRAGREGARRRAEETFDIRKIADQLWQEYQTVLARPRKLVS
jgi:glycosyltransferase involved in cell wall biosynthesis